MAEIGLVTLCGALRGASFNRKLMQDAASRFAADRTTDGDLRFPLYDGDLEAESGVPEAVETLAGQIRAADAVIIASPEYNQSISGVLKNALDWLSRVKGPVWKEKPVAIMSATAGRAGGARAQYAMRLALNPFQPRVLPGPEVLVGHAAQQFDEAGRLIDERASAALDQLMADLRAVAAGR